MKIGILSDTHGFLHPALLEAFRDVDIIFHAGDIGVGPILDRLRLIAPTFAVRGNIDGGDLYALDKVLYKEIEGIRFTVTHNAGDLLRPAFDLQTRILSRPTDILISGHYHSYWCAPLPSGDGLWLSPGAAGNSGHHQERMALLLSIKPRDQRTGNLIQDMTLQTVKFGKRCED